MNVTNNHAFVDAMRRLFTPGMRIKLVSMKDPSGVPDGTTGTIDFVDDAGQIQMKWDNGSSLALIYGEDLFQIIPDDCGTKFVITTLDHGQNIYFSHNESKNIEGENVEGRHFYKSISSATLYNSVEEAEEVCSDMNDPTLKIYPVCPRCHNEYDGYCAISRMDNKTEICEKCGLTEALWDFIKYEKNAKSSDPQYNFIESINQQKEITNL